MQFKKTARLLSAALGLTALFSVEAAAQAPAFSAVAAGNVVTIDIGLIPGVPAGIVQGHTLVVGTSPGGSELGTINLPASITHIVVTAPDGTYYLRARAFAGGITSAFSPEVAVTAGGPVCTAPPDPPAVTPTVLGGGITLNWGAIPGASRYDVLWSRTSGISEFADTTTTTKQYRWAGMLGTFFARVRVTTPCGVTDSAEVPFTITDLASGGGPRTPDPPPGQLLPLPSYGESVVRAMANSARGDLQNSCGNETWMFKLLAELRKRDSRWGMNMKRGNQGLSADIITYNGTNLADGAVARIYLIDAISGHCGGSPDWNWTDVSRATWDAGQAGVCSNQWCSLWTIDAYLRAGYPPDEKKQ